MSYRLLFVFLPLLLSRQAAAEDKAAWDCQQTDSGEWSCSDVPASQLPASALEEAPPVAKSAEKATLKQTVKQALTHLTGGETKSGDIKTEAAEDKSAPAQAAAPKRQEWTCQTVGENETRNCHTVDSEGKHHSMSASRVSVEESNWLLFGGAFDEAQESVFKNLQGRFEHDPWENCARVGIDPRQNAARLSSRNQTPLDANADYSELFDNEIISFKGNVELQRADQRITADQANYDTVSQTMDAQGKVFYNESNMAIYTDAVTMRLNSDEARLRDVQFVSAAGPLRGFARNAIRDNKAMSRYDDVAFTSCRPGNQDWVMRASRLKINQNTGMGSAKNTWLEFKGVPVLYTPYISFPTDGRRLSGLLSPTFGSTQKNGFDASLPFYWNIAPNMDATATVRYMSKRGEMFRGKFRYLTETSTGNIGGEYLPNDDLRNQARYSGTFEDHTVLTKHMNTLLDLNYVSDKYYFTDLNNALGFSNTRFLRSRADLNYNREGVDFLARAESYQAVDPVSNTGHLPYRKLPEVVLNLNHAFPGWPVELAMNNNYTYFQRSGRVEGQRFNIEPSVSFPLETSASFLIPKMSVIYSQYSLSNQLAGQPDSISRTLPRFSADAGLFFDRDLTWSGKSYVNTLEPRAYYLYVPYSDQSKIPLFDTAAYDPNFYSLFWDNRFSGYDRIQDANRVTLALTSRLIDSADGLERLKVSIGEIVHFSDRRVTLPGYPVDNSNVSNLVGEVSGQLDRHFSYLTGAQWNPEDNNITRGQVALRYRTEDNRLVNLGYRYRDPSIERDANISQTDVSFRWPLFDNWYGLGRWQYSLKFNQTTESFAGLEKESCCWRLRLLGRRYVNTITDTMYAKPDTAFFVQLELKGLSNFGDNVDDFLERNLRGYQKPVY